MNSSAQKLVVLSLLLASLASGSAYAQKASDASNGTNSRTDKGRIHAFENGEELLYVAEFSRALLRKMDVADFRFKASREKSTESGTRQVMAARLTRSSLPETFQAKDSSPGSSTSGFENR